MAFERGTFGFRLFHLPRPLPDDIVERLAEQALAGLNQQSSQEERTGWVTGRHLMDGNLNDQTAFYGGYLRLNLVHAVKKVPTALLQAECRMEELARMAADGKEFLNRKERKEVKDSISERLLPAMPYQLNAIPVIYEPGASHLYAGALSEKQLDRFVIYLRYAAGFEAMPMDGDELALRTRKIDLRQMTPSSFSADMKEASPDDPSGRDFLTWLWYRSESGGAHFEVPNEGSFGLMLQGPLTLVHEGHGAHETTLRKGEPLVSAEAKTCLLSGKKLRAARLVLARDEQAWQCGFEADTFTFRGMKLPDDDAMDPVGRFQERMVFLETFRKVLLHLFDQFLEVRREPATWNPEVRTMQQWVKERPTKS